MNLLSLLTLTEKNTHLVREIRKVFGPAGNKLDTMTLCEVVLHDSKERVAPHSRAISLHGMSKVKVFHRTVCGCRFMALVLEHRR
jgi:hypothetical protein